VVQVPLHGASAEEQLGADLPVGPPVPGVHGDLQLLRGQVPVGPWCPLARGLARGEQLAPGTLGEAGRSHRAQHLAGAMKLVAGVGPAVPATEPLPVEQVCASQVEAGTRPAEVVDGRLVEVLSTVQQRLRASLDAERPVGTRGHRDARQGSHHALGTSRLP